MDSRWRGDELYEMWHSLRLDSAKSEYIVDRILLWTSLSVFQHHCRHCQKIFCYYCSNNWVAGPKTGWVLLSSTTKTWFVPSFQFSTSSCVWLLLWKTLERISDAHRQCSERVFLQSWRQHRRRRSSFWSSRRTSLGYDRYIDYILAREWACLLLLFL